MIAVIGLGFVGLTTGLGLAHRTGRTVYAYDCDVERRNGYRQGEMPFHEPELREHLQRYSGKQFVICETMEEAVGAADFVFYCVGTPSLADGSTDLGHLQWALREGREGMSDGRFRVVVIKSTVPPGTTARVIAPLLEELGLCVGEHIGLASNPEFLREGSAWRDFMEPDRIIIGETDPLGGKLLEELYASAFPVPVHRVSATTSEFVKYMSNALLATLVSYANELAMVAEKTGGIDIPHAFRLLHEDKRWRGDPAPMTEYVYPGCGYGGYCLPKDTSAIIHHAAALGESAELLQAAAQVNRKVKERMAERIAAAADYCTARKIGILGVSFKPGSDDVRGAVSADIVRTLLTHGYDQITVYDPLAMEAFRQAYGFPVACVSTMEELVAGAEVIALITGWEEFKAKRHLLAGKRFVDGRYLDLSSEVGEHDDV